MSAQVVTPVSADEVRRLCGELLDWKMSAILALRPTLSEVAAAAARVAGEEAFDEPRPLDGRAASVYDLLTSDAEADEER